MIRFDTGISKKDLPDALDFPTKYQKKYSVTGVVMINRVKRVEPICAQVHVNAQSILLWKVSQEIFATSTQCPHQQFSLQCADIEDFLVTCPLHHFQFSLKTGQVQNNNACTGTLNLFPVEIIDDRIFILFPSFHPSLFTNFDDF